MKHHVARAMVLTRHCTRIESVTLEGKIVRPELCCNNNSVAPEFSVIIYFPVPFPLSLPLDIIRNANRSSFSFAGKNLYNNEHVAIKMVSKNRAFCVSAIRENLGELSADQISRSLAVAGTNEVKGTTATFRI